MAYCVHCGKPVGDMDRFCAVCGGAQQPDRQPPASDFWSNLTDRQTATLCYLPWVGWVAAVAVLASNRFRGDRRLQFHAFQGLYLFVAWLVVDWFLSPMFGFMWGFRPYHVFPNLFRLAVFGSWIFMLIKVRHGEDFRLPVIGDLAERSVAEQRL